MIHSVSQLGITPKQYYTFLEKLQHILPCKYCRNNFWRNLRSLKHSLPHEKDQLPLWSIHVHNTVSLDLDSDADVWEPVKTLHLLPEVSVETLFPEGFFYAVSLNVTDEKRIPVLRDFLEYYQRLLNLNHVRNQEYHSMKKDDWKLIDKAFTTLENDLSKIELQETRKKEEENQENQKKEEDVSKSDFVKISMLHFTDILQEKDIPNEKEIVELVYRSGDTRLANDKNFIRKTRKSKYRVGSATSDKASKSRKKSL
jgi:hypothetical protein